LRQKLAFVSGKIKVSHASVEKKLEYTPRESSLGYEIIRSHIRYKVSCPKMTHYFMVTKPATLL
jgi:hypothetical protein